ncbi:MAG: glycosyltransferase [Oscillospiraceae bacterium]|nr:glycosyltransferase [Oscillospiraceae bacterium]
MTLLYITFIDFNNSTSGSGVRPQKMYAAFNELGLEIKLLQGQQNRRAERRIKVGDILGWLDDNRPDICYIEPPSGPFFNSIDHKLLKKLKAMNIPIGLFYRDMYWKFGLGSPEKGLGARIKGLIIKMMHKRDWRIFMKTLSIIYFTTLSMADMLPVSIPAKALPPGCFNAASPRKSDTVQVPTGIYIGGLAELYGAIKMLKAAELIHAKGVNFNLKLICREAEWKHFAQENKLTTLPDWLEVLHISGDDALSEQYAQADFALCPHEVNSYNNITISVKIMEYLSYLKPVVVTETIPMKTFVTQNDIGIVTKDSVEAFADGMLKMIQNDSLRDGYAKNCLTARQANLWIKRAQSVVDDLISFREMKD